MGRPERGRCTDCSEAVFRERYRRTSSMSSMRERGDSSANGRPQNDKGGKCVVNNIRIRVAVPADIPVLRTLIDASVRRLQSQDYTPAQIEKALQTVFGVDSQLIADGTYLLAEANPAEAEADSLIVGCGGWSKRKTLYGGDRRAARQDEILDPLHGAA